MTNFINIIKSASLTKKIVSGVLAGTITIASVATGFAFKTKSNDVLTENTSVTQIVAETEASTELENELTQLTEAIENDGQASSQSGTSTQSAKGTSTSSSGKSVSNGSAQSILNNAPLNPTKTGSVPLDDIIASIIPSGGSTYDKVKACYDWLINNCSYGTKDIGIGTTELYGDNFYQGEDSNIVYYGYQILSTHIGVCTNYSCAFVAMARRIGLNAYTLCGTTTNKAGEVKGHRWAIIRINGTDYVFDPQVEDNQSSSGIKYTFFCKPLQNMSLYNYEDKEAQISQFHNFKTVSPVTVTVIIDKGSANEKIYSETYSRYKKSDYGSANMYDYTNEPITINMNGRTEIPIEISVSGGDGLNRIDFNDNTYVEGKPRNLIIYDKDTRSTSKIINWSPITDQNNDIFIEARDNSSSWVQYQFNISVIQ